jgi:hypothetical protein
MIPAAHEWQGSIEDGYFYGEATNCKIAIKVKARGMVTVVKLIL